MKNIILISMIFFSVIAYSAEITLLEIPLHAGPFPVFVNASLQKDGSVRVVVSQPRPGYSGGHYGPSGHYFPNQIPVYYELMDQTLKVDGLLRIRGRCVYHGERCRLESYSTGSNYDTRVIVKLQTEI